MISDVYYLHKQLRKYQSFLSHAYRYEYDSNYEFVSFQVSSKKYKQNTYVSRILKGINGNPCCWQKGAVSMRSTEQNSVDWKRRAKEQQTTCFVIVQENLTSILP